MYSRTLWIRYIYCAVCFFMVDEESREKCIYDLSRKLQKIKRIYHGNLNSMAENNSFS